MRRSKRSRKGPRHTMPTSSGPILPFLVTSKRAHMVFSALQEALAYDVCFCGGRSWHCWRLPEDDRSPGVPGVRLGHRRVICVKYLMKSWLRLDFRSAQGGFLVVSWSMKHKDILWVLGFPGFQSKVLAQEAQLSRDNDCIRPFINEGVSEKSPECLFKAQQSKS